MDHRTPPFFVMGGPDPPMAEHAVAPFLRPGDVAILGSLVTSRFPKAGERWRFELEGFEPLLLSIEP